MGSCLYFLTFVNGADHDRKVREKRSELTIDNCDESESAAFCFFAR